MVTMLKRSLNEIVRNGHDYEANGLVMVTITIR